MLELFNIIRLIPEVISVIFSFLPSWALLLIGSGSLMFIGLLIYKLLR